MGLLQRTGRFFFEWRDKLPVPLVLAMPVIARPRLIGWVFGLPFVFLGEAIRVWAIMHIGPTTRTRKICADRLVTSGPYCCCRNPLYLANLLKIAGILVITGHPLFALATMLFYALEFCSIIPYEESFLAEKFPEQFKEYKKHVPALVPGSGKQKKFDAPASFDVVQAVRSEKKTFLSTTAILLTLALADIFRRRQAA
ncbi:MAG: hypothetical protein PWR01_3675 [Clostridiales bacterium]|jgi:protein-S-isoprenylcysteine O-methyltransferase Ste14|nr:hypothetical protein [Clostridiales bacterium]MDN5282602.1 hypothetical protein [Candidatus Ozemobacter sp.]